MNADNQLTDVDSALLRHPRLVYMVEHPALGIRKVGLTASQRLDLWRNRHWSIIETIEYDDTDEMRSAEALCKLRLDKFGARGTPLMEQLYPNLDKNGRTEMYDPAAFCGSLTELSSDSIGAQLDGEEPRPPVWITQPRTLAALKANQHPGVDKSARARKAWVTIRARQEAELEPSQ